jgi:hypothetical protein
MTRQPTFVIRTTIVLAMLLLTPLAFRGGGELDRNLACSAQDDPACFREMDSVCTLGEPSWNYYARSGNR